MASSSTTYVVDLPDAPAAGPSSFPTFVTPPNKPDQGLKAVVQAVLKAKKVAVVVGAGISTAADIPDFRSSGGLFASLKERFPEARLTSGKDLFDVAAWKDPATLSLHLGMLGELHTQCEAAEPTAFHRLLKRLDDEGKLSRVYTQNIDGLERKAGLSYGVPTEEAIAGARYRPKKGSPLKRKRDETLPSSRLMSPPDTEDSDLTDLEVIETRCLHDRLRVGVNVDSEAESLPSSSQVSSVSAYTRVTGAPPTPRRTPRPAPVDHFARVIPLHGDLRTLSCPSCKHVEQMADHIEDLTAGEPVPCPQCSSFDDARAAAGARTRGVAMLKSGVVLYGEEHTEGERVGAVTSRDLRKGKRPDLLIVAGTTLKVPGTKKLVRELSKVIRPPSSHSNDDDSSAEEEDEDAEEVEDHERPIHTVFLNNEFLSPATQWKDVFDVWVRGDVQEFVSLIEKQRAAERDEKEAKAAKKLEMEAQKQARAEEKLARAELKEAKAEEKRLKAEEKEKRAQAKASAAAAGGKGKGKGKAKATTAGKAKSSTTAKAKKPKHKVEVVIQPMSKAQPKPKPAAVTAAATSSAVAPAVTQFFVMGKPAPTKLTIKAKPASSSAAAASSASTPTATTSAAA